MNTSETRKRTPRARVAGGRAKPKVVGLDPALWSKLSELAAKEDRSVAYMADRAVTEYIERRETTPT